MRKMIVSLLLCGCATPSPPAPDTPDAAVAPPDAATSAVADGGGELLQATEILGRPTATSIALSVVPAAAVEAYVDLGRSPGAYERQTPITLYPGGAPFVITIDNLSPGTRYAYRLRWRRPGEGAFSAGPERAFHTQRPPGATFRFTLQADSHLDPNSELEMYQRTLRNVGADAPDFHIDLGDTFMCDKHSAPLSTVVQQAPDRATVYARYLYERGHFGLIGHSSPLFLVNGNHEGEWGYQNKGAGDDLAVWATQARQRFYLNPTPDGFYSGDSMAESFVGQRAAWYAFTWGDALFVALDPYWSTKTKSNSDGWSLTLGERQYRWLEGTLAASKARFKFIFLHNLVGGLDGQMRGGVEAAPYFEWGGRNADGTPGLAEKRPGWGKPIHQILVENKVTAVFHGHDHVYVRQELDGILYQEVPQPSAKNTQNGPVIASDYHYASGKILSSAGHVRVTVSPDRVTTEYVRAWLPRHEAAGQKNGTVEDAWTGGPR